MDGPEPTPALEPDPRFTSGPWLGYYQQWYHQARQRLRLTFAAGAVTGTGRDPAGDFVVRGTYDARSGRCSLTKTYPGSHRVHYDGIADGDGIGGAWEIRYAIGLTDRGRFRIWPDASAAADAQHARAEEPVGAGA
jgi:hypothetical protein